MSRLAGDPVSFMVVMAVMLFFIVLSLMLESPEPKVIPLLVAGTSFILTTIVLIRQLLGNVSVDDTGTWDNTNEEGGWGKFLIIGAWVGGFILAVYVFGFLIGAFLFVVAVMKWSKSRWWSATTYAILVSIFIYGLFERALQIELHRGLFLPF